MTVLRDAVSLPVRSAAGARVRALGGTVDRSRTTLRGFLICLGVFAALLCAALMSLNVYLVHGTFTLQQLQRQSQSLERAQQSTGDRVASAESPDRLAAIAGSLGMEPAKAPIFLSVSGADAHRQVGVSVRH